MVSCISFKKVSMMHKLENMENLEDKIVYLVQIIRKTGIRELRDKIENLYFKYIMEDIEEKEALEQSKEIINKLDI